MDERVKRLEQVIVEVMKVAPQPMQALIRGLQALRGVAHISAITIAAELGNISSRFENARKLMGYCGAIPSEDSSGKRKRKGSITKAGNAHLRRIANRIGLELSASAIDRCCITQAPGRCVDRNPGDCVESAKPPAQALHEDGYGVEQMSKTDAMGFGDKTEQSTIAVEAPRPTVLQNVEARLVVAIKQFVSDAPRRAFIGQFKSLRTKPLHADHRNNLIGQNSTDCSVRLEVFETCHVLVLSRRAGES